MNPKRYVEMLAEVSLPSVFNPYADTCPIYDRVGAPATRRTNLEQYLYAAMEAPDLSLWVGRDLGYRGGRRTGIALTDEVNLEMLERVYSGKLRLAKATKGPVVSERTASVFWDMIGRLNTPVFTWNVFPFHPHEREVSLSNRCHTRYERLAMKHALKELITILRPTKVIAIGNDAQQGLEDLDVECLKVRHPSYGGVTDFRAGVAASHDLKDTHTFSTQPAML